MLKKIFLFLIFMLTATTHAQAEWVMASTDKTGGELHYFDPENVENTGHSKKVWVLSSYDQKQTGGYRSVKSLYEFDCNEKRARSYTMLLYPDEMATGKVIGAQHDKLKEWFFYPPNSIFSHIVKKICTK
jgi:hypothetical protein